ncbi:nuclease-related domain-containing protein [Salinibacterium sp. G-O1]|uniref:nuclease-related domain-containing protein n=1 Tax=Salinibacterium sp. G-O1 TaxID=3046208 RepID=UPI0024BB2655|nr:nuclease-related domain-containing protein [Salinibacterium sp. G-O1]MDJ0336024.1 nuclease-related domain-containing protein [Salinibacterium sp. G-O1]
MASMADGNNAGSSARREYDRRSAKDEARIRAEWGRFGGIAVALTPERPSTRAWATGAVGEERVGARLDTLQSDSVRVLHDRRIPGSKANVDHLVVTSSGIWVIDAKKYKGRPELRVQGGLIRPRVEKLFVNGREKTKLAEGVQWQIDCVKKALGDVPVRGILCFVEADWPLIGGSFVVNGIDVLWPKKLVSHIAAAQPGTVDVAAVEATLLSKFRAA